MVKAAKFAAIFCVGAVAIWAPASAMARPTSEVSCDLAVRDPLIQAAVDRRAIGGDPTALSFRAVCSWPMSASGGALLQARPDPKKDPLDEEGRITEAFFWTALNACTRDELNPYISSEPRGIFRVDAHRLQRFRSVQGALNYFDEHVKDDARALYMQRLAALGAPGLVELARTAECAIDADRATMYGILDAVKTAWRGQPGVSKTWGDFNPDRIMAQITQRVPVDVKRADSIKMSLLAGAGSNDGELRVAAAVAGIDDFATLDINWLLADITNFTFAGGTNPSQFSQGTLDVVSRLESRAGDSGDELNNGGDPPIYDDRDKMLTNVEIRNLVCWTAQNKKGSTTGLIAEGDLAWMYAYGKGYPKDLPKARTIIADVMSGAARILSVVDPNSRRAQIVKSYKETTWQQISDYVNNQVNRGKRRGYREFDLAGNYGDICPAEFNLPPLRQK